MSTGEADFSGSIGHALAQWRKEMADKGLAPPFNGGRIRTADEVRADLKREADEHWMAQQPAIWPALHKLGCPGGLVERVRSCQLDATPPMLKAEQWEKSGLPILLLLGGTRLGKTTAAVWLMSRLFREDRLNWPGDRDENGAPIWTVHRNWEASQAFVVPDALAVAKVPHWDPKSRDWDRFCSVKLLVLDDLGTEIDKMDGPLVKLLQARISRQLRTVITTNVLGPEFRNDYGDRIADRINEIGMVYECGPSIARSRQGWA